MRRRVEHGGQGARVNQDMEDERGHRRMLAEAAPIWNGWGARQDRAGTNVRLSMGGMERLSVRSRICFVVNMAAGDGGAREQLRMLPALIGSLGATCDVRFARRPAGLHAETEDALRAGFRTIVAVGGDGTVNAVASHLVGTDRDLGILPMGTFNYVARDLGIPPQWDAAVRLIADGATRTLDVGEVNGRIFLNNAGLGAYVMLVRRRERAFRLFGRSRIGAYLLVLRSLLGLRRSFALKVSVDGKLWRYRTPMAFIARNAHQLTSHGLPGADCIARRELALYVAPDCDRWQLLRLAIGLALGRLRPERDFALHCGGEILVETHRRTRHVVCDGERLRMSAPFHFRVRRDALRVIAPAVADAGAPWRASTSEAAVPLDRMAG